MLTFATAFGFFLLLINRENEKGMPRKSATVPAAVTSFVERQINTTTATNLCWEGCLKEEVRIPAKSFNVKNLRGQGFKRNEV